MGPPVSTAMSFSKLDPAHQIVNNLVNRIETDLDER